MSKHLAMPSPKRSQSIFILTLVRKQLTEPVTIRNANANNYLENSKTDTAMASIFLAASIW